MEGFLALYNGLSASLLRQATYSTVRFGVYEELKEVYSEPGKPLSLGQLILMASASGWYVYHHGQTSDIRIGGAIGNPADVLNVRMQNDMSLHPEQRRNYKHALDGLIRLVRDEGFSALTRGLVANTSRGVLMTAGQLASYDEFKNLLLKTGVMGDDLATHFTASFMAGFVATTMYLSLEVFLTIDVHL